MKNGIIYIVFNQKFVKEFLVSIESLKKHSPDIPVTVFCDKSFSDDRVDNLIQINPKHIRAKVDFINDSPYDNTLYLDSDTVINHDISDMFDIFPRFDVGATHDLARKRKKYCNIPEYNAIPYSFSEINGGIMSFTKNERTEKFLKLWKEYFYKYSSKTSGWDQVSLRISLWESGVNICHYPVEYNIRGQETREKVRRLHRNFGQAHLKERIYHMRHNCLDLDSAQKYCEDNFYKY